MICDMILYDSNCMKMLEEFRLSGHGSSSSSSASPQAISKSTTNSQLEDPLLRHSLCAWERYGLYDIPMGTSMNQLELKPLVCVKKNYPSVTPIRYWRFFVVILC